MYTQNMKTEITTKCMGCLPVSVKFIVFSQTWPKSICQGGFNVILSVYATFWSLLLSFSFFFFKTCEYKTKWQNKKRAYDVYVWKCRGPPCSWWVRSPLCSLAPCVFGRPLLVLFCLKSANTKHKTKDASYVYACICFWSRWVRPSANFLGDRSVFFPSGKVQH